MSRDVRVSMLLDMYGKMLTEVQYESVDYYYNQDLSLAEIAEIVKKSRQGVHDSIRRAVTILNNFDNALELIKKVDEINSVVESVKEIASQKENKEIIELVDKIPEILNSSKVRLSSAS